MSDDHETQFEAIEALLRAEPNSDASRTDAQLDAEFEAIMGFLDDINPDHAAELDAVAARARQDLHLVAQHDDAPDDPPTPSALRVDFKEVIPSRGRRTRNVLRPLGRAAGIVGLMSAAVAVVWGLVVIAGAVTDANAAAATDGWEMTAVFAALMYVIRTLLRLLHGLEWGQGERGEDVLMDKALRRLRRRKRR